VARGVVQRDDSRAPSGQYVLSPGDDTAVRELAAAFAGLNDFAVAGRLSGTSATFTEYASSFIADAAALAADNHADSEFQNDLVDSLRQKSDSASGVNLDEEVSDLMLYEQAYTASARVVQVLQQMFEALDRALG
jgi:flagellar hook-associated protein 1